MNDANLEEHQPDPSLSGRARPGPKGIGSKTALLLLLVGLLPVAAIPLVLMPISSKAEKIQTDLNSQSEALLQEAGRLSKSLSQQEKIRTELAAKLSAAEFERDHHMALHLLVSHLAGLVKDKSATEIGEDKAIAEALKPSKDPFDQVAVIAIDIQRVAASRSDNKRGELAKALPDLAARWAPDRPSPGPSESWNWRTIANTGYLVAVKASPPGPVLGKAAAQEAPVPIAAVDTIGALLVTLKTSGWALSLALPLFAIGLALIGFWWLRAQILFPVRNLSWVARQVIEDAGSVKEQDFSSPGLLEDLAASLMRLRDRMLRLRQREDETDREQQTLSQLKTALDRATAGHLGLRVQVEPGPTEELALSINNMLDQAVERIEGLRRAGLQIKAASERIHPVADQIIARLTPREPGQAPADPSALGDLLDVQIEGLCQTAGHVSTALEREAPSPLDNEDLEGYRVSLNATQAGFQLLNERIREAGRASDRIAALRQEAEVLSTNLAISAEAQSPAQMERLVEDARGLSRSVVDLSAGLSQSLGQLAESGDHLKEAFHQSATHFQQAARQLVSWEKLRRSMDRLGDEMSRRVELVHPGARSLGTDLRRLGAALTDCTRTQAETRELLLATAHGTASLADTADEVLHQLDTLQTGRPAPAGVTVRLAEQQQSLELAIQELSQVAASEGIDALSAEAQQILERIQSMAKEARTRIEQQADQEPTRQGRADPEA